MTYTSTNRLIEIEIDRHTETRRHRHRNGQILWAFKFQTCEEGLAAALGDEDASATKGEDDKSSSSTSDSASSCGVQSEDEEEVGNSKGKKRPRTSTAGNDKAPNQPQQQQPPPAGKKAKVDPKEKREKAQERLANSLSTHEKTYQAVEEVTPDAIWRSLIRTTELERKISRASAAATECGKIQANSAASDDLRAKAAELGKDLPRVVEKLTALKELSKCIRGFTAAELEKDISPMKNSEIARQLEICAVPLADNMHVFMDMIQAMAKKLLEVPWFQNLLVLPVLPIKFILASASLTTCYLFVSC